MTTAETEAGSAADQRRNARVDAVLEQLKKHLVSARNEVKVANADETSASEACVESEWSIKVLEKPLGVQEDFLSEFRGHKSLETRGWQQMIFATQQQTGGQALILGISLFVYETIDLSTNEVVLKTMNISKLDTTGLMEPRSGQRGLLRKFLHGILDTWFKPSDTCCVRVHILSTANPEYLFALSKENPEKRTLTGRKLIYWWRSMLNGWQSLDDVKKFWLIPGVQKTEIPLEYRNDTKWTWGYPEDEKCKSAMKTIPNFPDDAVSAVLKRSVEEESVSLDAFLMMLDSAPEFKKADVGIFVLERAATGADKKMEPGALQAVETQESMLDKVQKVLNMIDGEDKKNILTFETAAKAIKSTKTLLELIEDDAHSLDLKLKFPLIKAGVKRAEPATATPVVNVLTVKRRVK